MRSLYSLQNPMMLTPCCPSAGPTGGAGFALPASICSFTIAFTLRANSSFLLELLYLEEVELDRCLPSKEADEDLDFVPLGRHLIDYADKLRERSVVDTDVLPASKRRFHAGCFSFNLLENLFNFLLSQGGGVVTGTDKTGDAGRVAHHVQDFGSIIHLDQHVAREHFAFTACRWPFLISISSSSGTMTLRICSPPSPYIDFMRCSRLRFTLFS